MNHSTILLVEDNEDDVFSMKRALRKGQIANPLQVVTDGQQAVDYLAGTGSYADRNRFPLPFIIFLDLKLPCLDGFEVLSWMRQQRTLDGIVVVVLTSSAESRDHERAYALGARSYLIKPPTPEVLLDVLNSLQSLWLAQAGSTPVIWHQASTTGK
ncbi:MAG: response regulator [Verrucomicrobiota bacterium]